MTTIQEAVARIHKAMMKAREDAALVAIHAYGLTDMARLHWAHRHNDWNVTEERGRVSITELRHGSRVLWRQWIEVDGMTLTARAEWVAPTSPDGGPP